MPRCRRGGRDGQAFRRAQAQPDERLSGPLYGEDLAAVHAEAFAGHFDAGFDWLAAQVASGRLPAFLFDIGCGDGRWLAHARTRGIPGAGADISPHFTALARARGLAVATVSAATADMPAGTTAITAIGEVLSYVDPATGNDSFGVLLAHAAQVLPRGGLLIADLTGPGCPARVSEREGRGWRIGSETVVDGPHLVRAITLERNGRRNRAEHRLTIRPPAVAIAEAEAQGFLGEVLDGYGPLAMLPGRYGLRLTRC